MPRDEVADFDDPDFVTETFAREDGFVDRTQAWLRHREGPDLSDFAFSLVASERPARILEVGAGTGEFARRMVDHLQADVLAVDTSPRMVEISGADGVNAQVADVQSLPFPDGGFDMVVANYVLFLVSDLQAALREITRVLTDSGCLVATTQTEHSLPQLWAMLGAPTRTRWSFSSENGEELLERWFREVETHSATAELSFQDADEIAHFVAVSLNRGHLADRVPAHAGPLRATTRDSVFVARTPRRA